MQQLKTLLQRYHDLRKVLPSIISGEILNPPEPEPKLATYSRITSLLFSITRGKTKDRMHELPIDSRFYGMMPTGKLKSILIRVSDINYRIDDVLIMKEDVEATVQNQGVTIGIITGLLFSSQCPTVPEGSVLISFNRLYSFVYVYEAPANAQGN